MYFSYYEKYGEILPNGWVVTNFETLLNYEQPTQYIVKSTKYDDAYQTPVLTAGKSFILGYTNETDNIFSDVPVIIFDDFTTSSRIVDFDFKVKSSAMKILKISDSKKYDIEYMYYLLQTIRINNDSHKRFWISEYYPLKVKIHTISEQKKIVSAINTAFTILDSMSKSF